MHHNGTCVYTVQIQRLIKRNVFRKFRLMGVHTWFFKSIDEFNQYKSLYKEIDNTTQYESKEDYFNKIEELQILFNKFEAKEFFDAFRINNCLIDYVLTSKSQCHQFVYENYQKDLTSGFETIEDLINELNKFWDKYPNGVIEFG